MSGPDFDDLVGEGLSEGERARLRRVHELLLAAGAPPELPPRLAEAPVPERRHEPEVRVLPRGVPRRRLAAAIVVAAAIAAAAFGAGYLVGDSGEGGEAFEASREPVQMRGTAAAPDALASIQIGRQDDAGNWPMRLAVRGLYQLDEGGYYELLLTKKGRPAASCGTFNVEGERTVVELNAPYQFKSFDGWVVVRHHTPTEKGDVVLRT